MSRAILAACLILQASCSASGSGPSVCTGWQAILVDKTDILSDRTARAILAHDRYGRRQGCW